MLLQALCIISQPSVNSYWSYSPETPNLGQIRHFLKLCYLVNWQMTLQNNRAPLFTSMLLQALCIISCPLMNSNLSNSPETLNSGQKRRLFEPCHLEIIRMTLKTIGHLFYATSSFAQHFVPIGQFKPELQSGNAQFGSNLTTFRAVWA